MHMVLFDQWWETSEGTFIWFLFMYERYIRSKENERRNLDNICPFHEIRMMEWQNREERYQEKGRIRLERMCVCVYGFYFTFCLFFTHNIRKMLFERWLKNICRFRNEVSGWIGEKKEKRFEKCRVWESMWIWSCWTFSVGFIFHCISLLCAYAEV